MKFSIYAFRAVGLVFILPVVHSSSDLHDLNIGREVNTTSGIIRGHAASDRSNVSEYLGIPFAQPPIHSLRFAAPEPYISNGPFNATSFGLSCLAPVREANYSILTENGFNLAPTTEEYYDTIFEHGVAMGEDCLTLNVWAKPQSGEKEKAVLFFVYGGGFQIGFTSNPFTDGQYLADEQDVVVISANYRVNVFGFPGVQADGADNVAPNAGLLDQRLAIEWARDNVAAFGGDPKRITLFGQSAGAASISMYGYAYASDPIVHGLITQSGTADGFGVPPSNLNEAWQSLSTLLNCDEGDGDNTNSSSVAAEISCVRSRPAADVLAASLQILPSVSALGTFAPSADNGRTVFANYTEQTATGHFARVPRLIGSNAQEGGSFRLELTMQGANLPSVFWEWYTFAFFTCPASAAATSFATIQIAADSEQDQEAQHPPVWRYMYYGDYPNTRLTVDPSIGAYHGAELPPLFRTTEWLGIPDTPVEEATSRYMGAAWAAFAKDPHNGLAEAPFSWPTLPTVSSIGMINAAVAQTVLLGLGNSTSAVFEPSAVGDAPCPILMPAFEAIGGPTGLLALAGGANEALQGIRDGDVLAVSEALLQLAGDETE